VNEPDTLLVADGDPVVRQVLAAPTAAAALALAQAPGPVDVALVDRGLQLEVSDQGARALGGRGPGIAHGVKRRVNTTRSSPGL
jgi:hypothetical protein